MYRYLPDIIINIIETSIIKKYIYIFIYSNKNKNLSDINSLNENQHIAHGLSWYATYVESLLQLSNWIEYLESNNRLTDLVEGIAGVGAGEYCQQIIHGIPMSQNETIRPDELGIPREQIEDFIKITKSAKTI